MKHTQHYQFPGRSGKFHIYCHKHLLSTKQQRWYTTLNMKLKFCWEKVNCRNCREFSKPDWIFLWTYVSQTLMSIKQQKHSDVTQRPDSGYQKWESSRVVEPGWNDPVGGLVLWSEFHPPSKLVDDPESWSTSGCPLSDLDKSCHVAFLNYHPRSKMEFFDGAWIPLITPLMNASSLFIHRQGIVNVFSVDPHHMYIGQKYICLVFFQEM